MTRGTAEPRFCGSAVLRFSVLGSRFCDSFGQIEAQSATYSQRDRKSTRLNSSHRCTSYAVFCLKKKITLPMNFQRDNPRLQAVPLTAPQHIPDRHEPLSSSPQSTAALQSAIARPALTSPEQTPS